jgi:hypothetical protein
MVFVVLVIANKCNCFNGDGWTPVVKVIVLDIWMYGALLTPIMEKYFYNLNYQYVNDPFVQ